MRAGPAKRPLPRDRQGQTVEPEVIARPSRNVTLQPSLSSSPPRSRLGLDRGGQLSDGGDDLTPDDLEGRDGLHGAHVPDRHLDPHAVEPAELADNLFGLRAVGTDIEAERAGLEDAVVVAALGFAVATKDFQLARHLRRWKQVAGVGVASYQAQSLLLAAAADQDLGVRPAQYLRRIERPLEREMLSPENVFVSAPHLQADLERLLEDFEALLQGWEGNAKCACLLLVPGGADAEPGT